MQPALRHALDIPGRPDALRLVIFLTDGDVGNEQSLRRLISEKLGRARLFTLGIGAAPNEFLMRKMAADGRGQARFIHSQHDLADEIADLFRTLEKPVLTDIELIWRGESGERLEGIDAYPKLCPDVFHERPLQVIAKLPAGFGTGSLELHGRIGEKPFDHRCQLELGGDEDRRKGSGIARQFGRAQIDELRQRRLSAKGTESVKAIDRAITQLGIDYQLVTEFTSRIAVDDRGSRLPEAPLDRRRVPVPMPQGTQSPGGRVDPRLQFPKPMFVGTPVAVRLPNLERPGRPRLSLKAPPEAVLLSAGKPVRSSDELPIIGDLGMITDGDRDGADGSYVELAPGLHWVQIDLGKGHELFGIVLWHFHKNARAYLDVIVQISDDPEFRTGVTFESPIYLATPPPTA